MFIDPTFTDPENNTSIHTAKATCRSNGKAIGRAGADGEEAQLSELQSERNGKTCDP